MTKIMNTKLTHITKLAVCLTAFAALAAATALGAEPSSATASPASAGSELFRRDNLMAWCIVPFDSKKRGPEDRAAMRERLGFKHFAHHSRAGAIPPGEPPQP